MSYHLNSEIILVGAGQMAYEYAKVFSKFEKAYMQLQKATDELGSFVTKKTGEKVDQKIIEKQWKKQVIPFYKLMKSWIRGKM